MKVSAILPAFLMCVGLFAAPALAGDDQGDRPGWLSLRPDAWRFQDGSGGDLRDEIKNIQLDEHWTLSLGGQFRYRFENETNKTFGAVDPTRDSFHLIRLLYHAELTFDDSIRIYAEGIHAFDEDRSLFRRGIDENYWDLQQLYLEMMVWPECDMMMRVGRQHLAFGSGRFVSDNDWFNTKLRFDGVRLSSTCGDWDMDMWYAQPVNVQRKQNDHGDSEYDFWGVYATYNGFEGMGLDVYYFYQDIETPRLSPNFRFAGSTRHTLGARAWGECDNWDYEFEVAGQWGRWAGDRICAMSYTVDTGYTFTECPWMPRIGVGFDYATGDARPTDSKVGTFDQVFADQHRYFGHLDLLARQNVIDLSINMTAWPVAEEVMLAISHHFFWLEENRDAMYGSGRRDPAGLSGTEIGNELDVTLSWMLDDRSSVLIGYSHMWDSDFITQTGSSEDPDFFYVQYLYEF